MEIMVKHPEDSVQHETVRQFCAEVGYRISMAASRAEAMKMKEEVCASFRNECESMLVAHAASAYLENLIRKQWKEIQG